MELTDADVADLVTEIWSSMLQIDVEASGPAPLGTDALTAFISIDGDWQGNVVVQGTAALARGVAEAMFQVPASEIPDGEVADAFGEVVNMLGGSVKSMVEGSATLSLPTVTQGSTYAVPGSTPIQEAWFSTLGEPLCVRVHERATSDVGAR